MSTSNFHCHEKICWHEEAISRADATKSHGPTHEIVEKSIRMPDGSITVVFEHIKGKDKVTYSHKQHTKANMVGSHLSPYAMFISVINTKIVQWVAECMCPLKIVKDQGFECFMKTGRPGNYIPSPEMVSQDTKKNFAHCHVAVTG